MKSLIKKTIITLTAISIIASSIIFVPANASADSTPPWPNGTVSTVAKSSCLIDYDTGTVLCEKDAHKKRFPASITKILTALLTIENCDMNETVTYSKNALSCIRDGAANIGAKVGEKMSVKDALYGLMLHSGNECATALGEHMFGNEKTFATKLNERAKLAGAKDSHFVNGNGLHNENHYVTAYDMAMIMRAALKYPLFREIIGTTQYTIQKNNKRKHRFFATMRHKMIWEGGPYYYKGIIGGKTGFTDQSGNTLVTAAERNDLTLIAVVLKSDTAHVYTDTKKLFDYGFRNFKSINISENDKRFNPENDYALTSPFVKKTGTLQLDRTATAVIPKSANYSNLKITSTFNVTKGVFSKLTYNYGDKTVGTATLTYRKGTKLKAKGSDTEQETIAKITTPAPTTKKVAKTSSSFSAKKLVPIIIIVLCALVLIILIIALIKRKQKINRIRAAKRNRNRYTH
ncbi:MAG: D-alanyl-D-alanine carboxypeptidase [Eubacterium sp.]|nr:D-alanyl-D-alanine carboxypeptidase [Eubacterium sp.]